MQERCNRVEASLESRVGSRESSGIINSRPSVPRSLLCLACKICAYFQLKQLATLMNLKISIYALLTLKKPQTECTKGKERRSVERTKFSKRQRKINEMRRRQTRKKTQKRENVKLIKMKLSRTQGEGGSDGRWSGYRGVR